MIVEPKIVFGTKFILDLYWNLILIIGEYSKALGRHQYQTKYNTSAKVSMTNEV